jgi:hypothetical protein
MYGPSLTNAFDKVNLDIISSLDDQPEKEILQSIYDFHRKEIFRYAEVQLGLAKCLDCIIGGINYVRVNINLTSYKFPTLPAHALNFIGKISPLFCLLELKFIEL